MKSRVLWIIGVAVFFLVATPVSLALTFKGSSTSFLKGPLSFSSGIAQTALDLFYFKRNAEENRRLKEQFAAAKIEDVRAKEALQENARLLKLLNLRPAVTASYKRLIVSRVIARSSFAWNRSFLIDKGAKQGIRVNMLVLASGALVGKVVEVGPAVSKVMAISDPSFRMGILMQRTRDQGIIYGAANGRVRVKYIPVDTELKQGDLVETAGLGGFFLKGVPVAVVERFWKEPGQIYQVVELKPLADLNRLEEVVCVE